MIIWFWKFLAVVVVDCAIRTVIVWIARRASERLEHVEWHRDKICLRAAMLERTKAWEFMAARWHMRLP